MPWGAQPVIHEVNTFVWLGEIERRVGSALTLASVPAEAWDELCLPGVDAVWLMGVWERSPRGIEIGRTNPSFVSSHRASLPDMTDADVVGSPYCVRRYDADARLGGRDALASARTELARRGVALVLDYVPNHVAPDHPWIEDRPDAFITGSSDDLHADPASYIDIGGRVVAMGRDPYFPAWPDVVQLNAFSPTMRAGTVDTLNDLGTQCDGLRCDMAMLMVNEVFARTWGARAGQWPAAEFWEEVIGSVRQQHPMLYLAAEAYWDMEGTLLSQGFDACYDKRLYDRLVSGEAAGVRGHLGADTAYQRRMVRFIENHDEPRAAAEFAPGADRAAAVAIATLPGTTLWHEGQMDGRVVRVPVLLGRRPDEQPDPDRRKFYENLLTVAPKVRRGAWATCPTSGWPDNNSHEQLLTWTWTAPDGRALVAINLSGAPAQGHVHIPWNDLAGTTVGLQDLLSHHQFDVPGNAVLDEGLFVDLPAWGAHVFSVTGG
jgi:hypothetical protein